VHTSNSGLMIWNVLAWVASKPSVARIEFGGHERFKEECREADRNDIPHRKESRVGRPWESDRGAEMKTA
jgi:hypothetical protein